MQLEDPDPPGFWKKSWIDDTWYHNYPDGNRVVYFPSRWTGSSMTRPCEAYYDSLGRERWYEFFDR